MKLSLYAVECSGFFYVHDQISVDQWIIFHKSHAQNLTSSISHTHTEKKQKENRNSNNNNNDLILK